MNLVLYFSAAVVVLAIAVVVYSYRVIQIILVASGLKNPDDETLTTGWVHYLFILAIGFGLASIYIYSKLN